MRPTYRFCLPWDSLPMLALPCMVNTMHNDEFSTLQLKKIAVPPQYYKILFYVVNFELTWPNFCLLRMTFIGPRVFKINSPMPFTVIYNCELAHAQNHYIKCHFLWFFASSNGFFSSSLVAKWENIFFPGYTNQNEPIKLKLRKKKFFELRLISV